MGAELFYADRRADTHDEANRRFSQNYQLTARFFEIGI
jgi:hypothetical protein